MYTSNYAIMQLQSVVITTLSNGKRPQEYTLMPLKS